MYFYCVMGLTMNDILRNLWIPDAELVHLTSDKKITTIGISSGHACRLTGTTDNDNPFSAYWRSKDLDFSEELGLDASNILKTIDRVRLYYEDIEADTPILFSLSIDGGNTWITRGARIGVGDGASKAHEFDFSHDEGITGYFFTFKIECPSEGVDVKWNGFSIEVIFRGIKFDVE